jgi:NADH:ubiquinone oxidoreductase subunit H
MNLKVLFLIPLVLWAELALGARAQGNAGAFGIGKETTWGTAVAVTDYMELLSENVSPCTDFNKSQFCIALVIELSINSPIENQ